MSQRSEMLVPMQVTTAYEIPGDDFWYELKYDGIRAVFTVKDGKIGIHTRNLNDVTSRFPELDHPEAFTVPGVYDGEIILAGSDGKPDFHSVVGRVNRRGRIKPLPAIQCYLFDCLEVDGEDITRKPLEYRRGALEQGVSPSGPFRLTKVYEDGGALFEAAERLGLEGIIAKRRGSRYWPRKRTTDWLRIKVTNTADCLVIGYAMGEGRRAGTVGSLRVAEDVNGEWVYRGKVGTGFRQAELDQLFAELREAPRLCMNVKGLPRRKDVQWVDSGKVCEVAYLEVTRTGTFRHPSFIRWRPDKAYGSVPDRPSPSRNGRGPAR